MSSNFGVKRFDAVVLGVLALMFVGIILTVMICTRADANFRTTTHNLQQIGKACLMHNDTVYMLPHNGGANDDETLKKVNFGWHDPIVKNSGTWATQILPFLKQEQFFRDNVFTGVKSTDVPVNYPASNLWQVAIPEYLCAERGRTGFKTSRAVGCYPGPVTDFAINIFLNSDPAFNPPNAPDKGFAKTGKETWRNGDWAATCSRLTAQGIADGASNTILIGGKALPPAMFKNDEARQGDEGIFSPGNWSLNDGKKTLISTGTGRGHVVVANPPSVDQTVYPADGGVPWMYRDNELTGDGARLPYELAWGSPFKDGMPFLFSDGSVRVIKYNQKGTINFAHLLYPNDCVYFEFEP